MDVATMSDIEKGNLKGVGISFAIIILAMIAIPYGVATVTWNLG